MALVAEQILAGRRVDRLDRLGDAAGAAAAGHGLDVELHVRLLAGLTETEMGLASVGRSSPLAWFSVKVKKGNRTPLDLPMAGSLM